MRVPWGPEKEETHKLGETVVVIGIFGVGRDRRDRSEVERQRELSK